MSGIKGWLEQLEVSLKKEPVLGPDGQQGALDSAEELERMEGIHKELLQRRCVLPPDHRTSDCKTKPIVRGSENTIDASLRQALHCKKNRSDYIQLNIFYCSVSCIAVCCACNKFIVVLCLYVCEFVYVCLWLVLSLL